MSRAHVTLDELLRLRHRARGFSFLPRQPVHSLLTGRHASRLRGRGLDFEELRHYFEGDDTRTIDWSATARRGSPHVRVYTEERDRSVLLLVDQRMSMFFGSRRAMKSVAAAEAAALAAFRVTSLGDRVGAIVFSEQGVVEIRPEARDAAVRRILAEVVRQNRRLSADGPPADPSLLNQALGRAARLAHARLAGLPDLRRGGRRCRNGAAGDGDHRAQRRAGGVRPRSAGGASCPISAAPCWPRATGRSRSTCRPATCGSASPTRSPSGGRPGRASRCTTRFRCCRSPPTATSPNSSASSWAGAWRAGRSAA